MRQITFSYYPRNSKVSPDGDGDIKVKAETLSRISGTPYTTLSVAKICAIAFMEWLAQVDPAAAPRRMQPPITDLKKHVSFTIHSDDLESKIRRLRDADRSQYRYRNISRIYVIGINAWLDEKLAEHSGKV